MGQLQLGASHFGGSPRSSIIETAVPAIIPSNGTVATSGIITLATALPTTYSDAWIYLPAGAVIGGLAGMYYCEFTSTTVGQVFTEYRYPADKFVPRDPNYTIVAAVGSNSAYTQTTGSDLVMIRQPVPAGLMGPTGHFHVETAMAIPANTNAKTTKINFGSMVIHNLATAGATIQSVTFVKDVHNRGFGKRQVSAPYAQLGFGANALAMVYGTEDTISADVSVTLTGQLAVATDYMVLEFVALEVDQS